jgi:signal transduction histidine kinase
LVVDSGSKGAPITDEEFAYLLIMADLVAETVGKTELVGELIESYEKRRELILTMTDYLRNRFVAIGGFARRLHNKLQSGEEKSYALVISNEIEKLEERLETIEAMFKEEEKRIGRA